MAKLLSSLNVGDKVRFGKHQINSENREDIIWKIGHKNKSGYPNNSITLVTENIIDIRGFDAKEPSNNDTDRRNYGNNRYRDSNIRQWLNKKENPWFVKTHNADEPPTNAGTNNYNTGYDNRPGFLSAFSDEELNAILDTTLTVALNTVTDGGGSETVVDKVFLLSNTEVGLAKENNIDEGSKLDLFSDNTSRIGKPNNQVVTNSGYSNTNLTVSKGWYWWLRTPYAGYSRPVRYVHTDGTLGNHYAYHGYYGVRPALNLLGSIMVSDSPDSNGVYTLIHNTPPTISGQDTNLGDKNVNFNISYQVNDPDSGDSIKVVEKLNGSTIRTIDPAQKAFEYTINIDVSGLNLGGHTVTIEATDSKGATAIRTYTFRKTNAAPTISGQDENLGDKNLGFQIVYQVDDIDGDPLTVVEKLNGDTIRTRNNPPKNQDLTIDISNETIRSLPLNSSNSITIEVDDGKGGLSYRTYTFKRVNTPPYISGVDDDLGTISGPFTRSYSITDAEGDDVIVKEFLNDRELKSYQATLGASNTTEFTADDFIKLPNGIHEFRIQATDIAGTSTIRVFTFEKMEDRIAFKLKNPFITDDAVTKIFITPTWNIEGAETVSVKACNNAFDDEPAWEDITDQVLEGRHFNLTNDSKTADDWGVDVMIEVVKGVSEIEISGFGGAFE